MKTTSFVKFVGQMPFTGRHNVRHYYAEGVRAARRGQEELKHRHERELLRFGAANSLMGLAGLAIAGFGVAYGIDQQSWQFAAEVAVGTLYGVGHTASAAANLIIRRELQAQPVSAEPTLPPRPGAISPPNQPTLAERLVTDGGAFVALAGPVAHVALYQYFGS